METIKFNDLRSQWEIIKSKAQPRMMSLMENCPFILGPDVKTFEDNLAKWNGNTFCIGVIWNAFASLPKGVISVAPINVPLRAAAPLSSSVAPKARARSLASPAPAAAATAPATGKAAGPSAAAGSKAPIEPMPAESL